MFALSSAGHMDTSPNKLLVVSAGSAVNQATHTQRFVDSS